MKKLKLTLLFCTGLVVLNLLTSCATFSQNSLEQGQYFALIDNYKDFYDSSIPIEEQCYVINIASGVGIRINGRPCISSGSRLGQIVILPSGRHDFYFSFYDQHTRVTEGEVFTTITTTTYKNEKKQTRTLEAGHYYFIEWLDWTQSPIIGDLKEQSSLEVDVNVKGVTYYDRNVPVPAIIDGMNTALKRVFPNFNPPL